MLRPVSCFGETHPSGGPGLYLFGALEAHAPALMEEYREKVQLIYLDPPFCTGSRFLMSAKNHSEAATAYDDDLGTEKTMALLRLALTICSAMLAPTGSIYVHIDYRMGARVKLLMDEVFGESNFMNEIIWSYKSGGRSTKHYSRKHDTLLFYRKTSKPYFNIAAVGAPRGAQPRNHMKRRIDSDGRIYFSIRSGAKTYKYYEDSLVFPSDVWDDVEHLHQRDPERTGYATQKPEALLKRVVLASSREGDLVADLFAGSGTTAAVCAKLNRRYLTLDASPLSLLTFRKRLLLLSQAASFLEERHEMRFLYKTPPPFAQAPRITMESERLVFCGTQNGAALSCLATGYMENGIFLPHAHVFSPREGDALPFDASRPLVVQACDEEGRMGFFELK